MTSPNHGLISYLAAVKFLRDTEQRAGTEPPERQNMCPTPSDLLELASSQVRPRAGCPDPRAWVAAHAAECPHCRLALESLRSALTDEPLPEMPEHAEDPVAAWVMSGKPARREKGASVPGPGPTITPGEPATSP